MKIRTAHVTNSSSSSFVMIRCKNPKLAEIMQNYIEELEDEYMISIEEDDTVNISLEEGYVNVPIDKDGILCSLLELFTYGEFYIDDEEEMDEYLEELLEENEVAREIFENKKEIAEQIGDTLITYSSSGWGGDDDTRYCRGMYDEGTLQTILETIAKENNCTPEEVDEEMFNLYVGEFTSVSEETFEYNAQTGKVTTSRNYELL